VSDISFHFEGLVFSAAAFTTVVLAGVLAAIAAAVAYTLARSRGRGPSRPETLRVLLSSSACFVIGAFAFPLPFIVDTDTAGYAFRASLDTYFYLVPIGGFASWALVFVLATPGEPRA
jgi:hypothetical protein